MTQLVGFEAQTPRIALLALELARKEESVLSCGTSSAL